MDGNMSALEYIDRSLERQRRLDRRLRERLEVLYVALRTNWTIGRRAEALQTGARGSTLYERTLKAVEDDRKRGDDSPGKRKREFEDWRGSGARGGRGGRGGRGYYKQVRREDGGQSRSGRGRPYYR
jgi:hypothetical protein